MGEKFSRKRKDFWLFMPQNDLLDELEEFNARITSQTLRRWRKDCIISLPVQYNMGIRQNVTAYRIFTCAEVYATLALTMGKLPKEMTQIASNLLPGFNIMFISTVRKYFYGYPYVSKNGYKIPPELAVEDEIGALPNLPIADLNISTIRIPDDVNKIYDEFYSDCTKLYGKFYKEGFIKFYNSKKTLDPCFALKK